MNNNLEFENEDPNPDNIEDNHPRTNYGEGFICSKNGIKREGESCTLNNNCKYPDCIKNHNNLKIITMFKEQELVLLSSTNGENCFFLNS